MTAGIAWTPAGTAQVGAALLRIEPQPVGFALFVGDWQAAIGPTAGAMRRYADSFLLPLFEGARP